MSIASPVLRARRRRRRWPIVALVLVLALAGVFVAADRIAVAMAENRVAAKLAGQRPFSGKPSVHIHGFPFLTQAVGGTYHDIELTGLGEPLVGMVGAHVDARLHGAHIPLSAARKGVDTVPVDRVDVTVTVPLLQLARVVGVPNLTLSSHNGDLEARAPASLPGIGSITLSATVHLAITRDGLDGTLGHLSSLGGLLPGGVTDAARQAMHIHVALPDLGFSSAVGGVHVVGGNVVFSGSAHHVVLR